MSDPVSAARAARENLARALGALQSPGLPPQLMSVAEPIAHAMSALHRIETSNGAATAEGWACCIGRHASGAGHAAGQRGTASRGRSRVGSNRRIARLDSPLVASGASARRIAVCWHDGGGKSAAGVPAISRKPPPPLPSPRKPWATSHAQSRCRKWLTRSRRSRRQRNSRRKLFNRPGARISGSGGAPTNLRRAAAPAAGFQPPATARAAAPAAAGAAPTGTHPRGGRARRAQRHQLLQRPERQ